MTIIQAGDTVLVNKSNKIGIVVDVRCDITDNIHVMFKTPDYDYNTYHSFRGLTVITREANPEYFI